MTDQQHPITPPQELIEQWIRDANHNDSMFAQVAIMGAHWGADQELEECCNWLEREVDSGWGLCAQLRADRRPQSPSLKETLLARVARIPGEGADTAYLHHWLENESQRLVDALHKTIKSLPD